MRTGFGAGILAAVLAAIVSFAVEASPLAMDRLSFESLATRNSLLHKVLIYAKERSAKLVDGRWNLSKSEAKLGIRLSDNETQQLMACTGRIVCYKGSRKVFGSAASVLRPDLLVTAKHLFSTGKGAAVSFRRCSFRSFLHRNVGIPVLIEKDQRKGYFLNNEDFIVVRLKRELKDCNSFAINDDTFLSEGEKIFSATGYQRNGLNRLTLKEPVLAKGTIRSVSTGFWGGPPFYHAEIDLDEGGSGGAIFALRDGRPVLNSEGRLILRGLLVATGPKAKNGKPYSEEQNYTIIVGIQDEFRDLVVGKANRPFPVEQTQCFQGGQAKIDVISEPVPLPQSAVFASPHNKCIGNSTAACRKLAYELKELAKGIEKLAASTTAPSRGKGKRQFKLRNDTNCSICFTYDRCNEYGCWDEVVRASGKSTLFAGLRQRPPLVRDPQFCKSGQLLADWRPPLPLTKPDLPPPLPARKPGEKLIGVADSRTFSVAQRDLFSAAKKKAQRKGVWMLTDADIRGLSLEQISELRGY